LNRDTVIVGTKQTRSEMAKNRQEETWSEDTTHEVENINIDRKFKLRVGLVKPSRRWKGKRRTDRKSIRIIKKNREQGKST
jgi:hypothetical protein